MAEKEKRVLNMQLRDRVDDKGVEFILRDIRRGEEFRAKVTDGSKPQETLEEAIMGMIFPSSIHTKILRLRQKILGIFLVIGLILLVALTVFYFIWEPGGIVCKILLNILGFILMLSEAVAIIYLRIKKDESVEKYLRLQVATNRVRNAYLEHKRIPTIEEARKADPISTVSRYLTFTFAIPYIGWVLFLNTSNSTWAMIFLAWTVTALILDWKKMFCFFQYLIYAKPTDEQYQMAIYVLKFLLEHLPEDVDVQIKEK